MKNELSVTCRKSQISVVLSFTIFLQIQAELALMW